MNPTERDAYTIKRLPKQFAHIIGNCTTRWEVYAWTLNIIIQSGLWCFPNIPHGQHTEKRENTMVYPVYIVTCVTRMLYVNKQIGKLLL